MIRIQQMKIQIPAGLSCQEFESYEKEQLQRKIIKFLRISEKDCLHWSVVKRSLDARKKPELFYSYLLDVRVNNETEVLCRCHDKNISQSEEKEYCFPTKFLPEMPQRPVIVGMGPAGLFCGYFLAREGFSPLIIERGKPVEERKKDVLEFWKTGILNPESNVQFGEGGAGTFSDGKLNTLVKDKYGRNREVLKIFVKHGAPENILYEQKPHIGTDILINVLKSMRKQLLAWGAEIRYGTKMTEILYDNNKLSGILLSDGSQIKTEHLVLAVGHSARDTFQMCDQKKIPMESKPFAVGFRVEHPQKLINNSQYGEDYPECLPAAAYKVTAKTDYDRGVYSFCMCPGGYVVNASSEEGLLAINGMSYSARKGENSNSAIIISVNPKDFSGQGALSGVEFQRQLERKAYELGNGKIPVQYYKDFKGISEHTGHIPKDFLPSMKGQYCFSNVREILPEELQKAFLQGMEHFHKILPGFGDDYALISGIESRTSSPLRILRDADGQSSVKGLYPCGEGAGYAGGITSAAMDGIFIAERIALNHALSMNMQ